MSQSGTHPAGQRVAEVLASVWWLPLLRGILLVLLGGFALFRPGMAVGLLTQVIGVFILLDGILAIVAGVLGQAPSRGWTLVRGVIEILVGVFVLAYPALIVAAAGTILLYVLACGVILAGVLEIAAAIRDRNEIQGEGWLILGGVLAIVFGLLVLIAPLAFGRLIVQILGIYAILSGVGLVVFAFRLRGLPKALAARSE